MPVKRPNLYVVDPPAECTWCGGTGAANVLDDCMACAGSGYQDKHERAHCERCGKLERMMDMHISPDEDDNRIVCAPCNFHLEDKYAS